MNNVSTCHFRRVSWNKFSKRVLFKSRFMIKRASPFNHWEFRRIPRSNSVIL